MNNAQLAGLLGVSRQVVGMWVAGKRQPTPVHRAALISLFGIVCPLSPEEFIQNKGLWEEYLQTGGRT
jgi:DNA-binding transcriptional regulator YdaS (Cro superfamily)